MPCPPPVQQNPYSPSIQSSILPSSHCPLVMINTGASSISVPAGIRRSENTPRPRVTSDASDLRCRPSGLTSSRSYVGSSFDCPSNGKCPARAVSASSPASIPSCCTVETSYLCIPPPCACTVLCCCSDSCRPAVLLLLSLVLLSALEVIPLIAVIVPLTLLFCIELLVVSETEE